MAIRNHQPPEFERDQKQRHPCYACCHYRLPGAVEWSPPASAHSV